MITTGSKGLVQGLHDCCDQFGVSLIGGDTTQSPHLTISVTALGWIEQGHAIPRSGAQVGDYICVSGQVGDAAFGLDHLDHPLKQRLRLPNTSLPTWTTTQRSGFKHD